MQKSRGSQTQIYGCGRELVELVLVDALNNNLVLRLEEDGHHQSLFRTDHDIAVAAPAGLVDYHEEIDE